MAGHVIERGDSRRSRPEARPAGEGRYALVGHGDHTHLTYALELPEQPGDVQEELDIRLDTEVEDTESAEIFRRLPMRREKHLTEPLTKGEWR